MTRPRQRFFVTPNHNFILQIIQILRPQKVFLTTSFEITTPVLRSFVINNRCLQQTKLTSHSKNNLLLMRRVRIHNRKCIFHKLCRELDWGESSPRIRDGIQCAASNDQFLRDNNGVDSRICNRKMLLKMFEKNTKNFVSLVVAVYPLDSQSNDGCVMIRRSRLPTTCRCCLGLIEFSLDFFDCFFKQNFWLTFLQTEDSLIK